ncbi:hypothetical protein ACQ4PT_063298 [Festuca glaucescens]
MEAALVTVSTGVIKPLLSKLFKLLGEEHAKLKGVRRDAKFIGDEMRSMQAALETLADEELLDPELRIWRDAVRELSYGTEDCVDDFVARVDHDHDGCTTFKKLVDMLKKPKYHHRTANEIGKLKTCATEASERHKRYSIVRPTPDISNCAIDPLTWDVTDPRLPALYVEVDKLVGIDGPKDGIIDWFQWEATSTQLQVLSIVGSGGLGKTTLANQVYHAIRGQFSCAAFVSVSRNPNMRKILRDIAKGVGVTDNTPDDDVQQLIDKLRIRLQDERYFVVIDDVWSAEKWRTIRLALLNSNRGSRIITTTRNNEVASCCSSCGGRVYEMEPLSFADSKRLFLKRAFGPEDSCYSHLEEVSNEILRKCSGLPLAIITVSSLLADQHPEDEWKRVLAAIGSALAKDPGADKMTKILSLSYFDLPHHLRTCLLYLSMFPEDSTILKQHLILHYRQVSLLAFPPAIRVLDLGHSQCWWLEAHHVASIEKLFLLKYLRLANVTLLPRKIGELQYLETLDITNTRILFLKEAVTCFHRLTSLYVHSHTRFPDGMIGKMQSLEELEMFGVHSYEQGKSLQELSQLTKLRRELELYVVSVRPEDVTILGSVPTLLFLTLKTFNGTDGRILLHGFSSLKYLCLELLYCGTSLEFEAGSMPRLEHLELEFRVHRMDCLNGSSNFGIQHLSALRKVEVCICCNFGNSENPLAGLEYCFGKYIGSLIETAVETLPNCSSLLSQYGNVAYANVDCEHYTKVVGTEYEKEDEVGQDAGAHHWHVGGNHALMLFGYTKNVISQSSSIPEGVFFRWMTLMEACLLPRPVIHKRRRRTALEESMLMTSSHVAARNGGRPGSTIRSCARVLRRMGIFQEDEERSQKRILIAIGESLITLSPSPRWRLWRLCLVGHFLDEQLVEQTVVATVATDCGDPCS